MLDTPVAQNVAQVRCVGQRVDALVLAFDVTVEASALSRILAANELAERPGAGGVARVELGELCGVETGVVLEAQLRTCHSERRFAFSAGDWRGVLDVGDRHGWTLELVARARYLARTSIDEAIEALSALASCFGSWERRRLRRVDLCVDVTGYDLHEDDCRRLLLKRRGRTEKCATFVELDGDGDAWEPVVFDPAPSVASPKSLRRVVRTFHKDAGDPRTTGFLVCPGNPLSARIYDKTLQIALLPEADREDERSRWEAGGWNRVDPITRIEFQVRGRAIDEFDLRDPAKLSISLRDLWRYLTRDWLRCCEPDSGWRRCEWKLDPRWVALRSIEFASPGRPVARRRLRSRGVGWSSVFGSLLSFLGSWGALPIVTAPSGAVFGSHVEGGRRGELLPHKFGYDLHWREELRTLFGALCDRAFSEHARELEERGKLTFRELFEASAERIAAVRASFAELRLEQARIRLDQLGIDAATFAARSPEIAAIDRVIDAAGREEFERDRREGLPPIEAVPLRAEDRATLRARAAADLAASIVASLGGDRASIAALRDELARALEAAP